MHCVVYTRSLFSFILYTSFPFDILEKIDIFSLFSRVVRLLTMASSRRSSRFFSPDEARELVMASLLVADSDSEGSDFESDGEAENGPTHRHLRLDI